MVVTACSSEEEFQVLAMRFAARVLLPGTGWIAFTQLMDLVALMMDLLGKSFLPRGSLALLDFHTIRAVWEATISFRGRRPAFSNTDFEDTLSLKLVFVTVQATDLIDRLMFSVASHSFIHIFLRRCFTYSLVSRVGLTNSSDLGLQKTVYNSLARAYGRGLDQL